MTTTTETRNAYGFPIVERLQQARQYADAARERNKLACQCVACKQIELLPAVQRLTQNWKPKS